MYGSSDCGVMGYWILSVAVVAVCCVLTLHISGVTRAIPLWLMHCGGVCGVL